MKKKVFLITTILICSLIIINILLAIYIPVVRLKWSYGFGSQTVTTHSYPEYDRLFITTLDDDILYVDSFNMDKSNIYDREGANGFSSQGSACVVSVNMETVNEDTHFTYLWVFAREVGTPTTQTSIDVDGVHIDISTNTINGRYIETATCVTDKSIGSSWLSEQLEKLNPSGQP